MPLFFRGRDRPTIILGGLVHPSVYFESSFDALIRLVSSSPTIRAYLSQQGMRQTVNSGCDPQCNDLQNGGSALSK